MNKPTAKHTTRLARPTILGLAVILAACGPYAASASGRSTGEGTEVRVIRDPDNPAWTGVVLVDHAASASVIRDPDNPYWKGSAIAPVPQYGASSMSSRLR